MTQEQVKALMDKMDFPAFNAWGYELMLKFYQAAQKEAYERAASYIENESLPDCYSEPCLDDFAGAIRKLAED